MASEPKWLITAPSAPALYSSVQHWYCTVQWAPKIMTAHLIIIATSLCVYWLLHESKYPPVPSYVHLPSMLDHFILTLALPLLCSVFDLFIPPDPSYFFPQCLVSLYLPLPYSFSVFDLFIPPVPSYFFPQCLNSLFLLTYPCTNPLIVFILTITPSVILLTLTLSVFFKISARARHCSLWTVTLQTRWLSKAASGAVV